MGAEVFRLERELSVFDGHAERGQGNLAEVDLSRNSQLKPTRKKFEGLALEQLDMLYRVARRLARNSAAAEDLVQETYVRAIQSWEGFELQESRGIRPWLIRLMYNLHIDRLQREFRQPRATDQEILNNTATPVFRFEPMGIGTASMEMMDERLVRALKQLPEEHQTVVLLWAVEEMAYKEIADALDIPIGTVMSRLHRARAKLSEELREYAVKEGMIRATGTKDQ